MDGDPDDAAIVIDSQSARGITITGNYFHTEYDGGPFIAFEHTAGGSYNVQELTVIGNIFYGVNGTKTNGITFANSLTNGSKSFHIENNVWRTATVYSTSENDRQIGTHAASFTPNPMLGRIIEITITGNIAIGLPANANHGGIGNRITFLFIQDGTGSRDVSWHANYKQGWSDAGSAADARSTITFEWDGTNWNQVGAQSPYI